MVVRSRGDIRREAAGDIGDVIPVIQTSPAGSLSTFTDERRLTFEQNYYAGADIIITGGVNDNLNEVRYVLSSDATTATLTITPDWNVEPAVGTPAELYNIQGMGGTVHEWNGWINQAINEAAPLFQVPKTVSLGAFAADPWSEEVMSYEGRQQSLVIPNTIEWAGFISYTRDGRTYYPDRGSRYSGEGWRIDDVTRRVILDGQLAYDADGATVYLHGFGPPEPMYTDQDSTSIPTAFLMAKIKALAYARISEKGLFEYRGEATKWEGIAKDEQRKVKPAEFPPNTVHLWPG